MKEVVNYELLNENEFEGLSLEAKENYKQSIFTEYESLVLKNTSETFVRANQIFDRNFFLFDEPSRNRRYNDNRREILKAVSWFIKNGTVPTYSQLAEYTGLCRQKVREHLENLHQTKNESLQEIFNITNLFVPRMLAILMQRAENGDLKAMELFFKIVGSQQT